MCLSVLLASAIWQGGLWGYWHDPDNWSTGNAPGWSTAVEIQAPEASVVDLGSDTAKCLSFSVAGEVCLSHGKLNVLNTSSVLGSLELSSLMLNCLNGLQFLGSEGALSLVQGSTFEGSLPLWVNCSQFALNMQDVYTSIQKIDFAAETVALDWGISNSVVSVADDLKIPSHAHLAMILSDRNYDLTSPVLSVGDALIIPADVTWTIDASLCSAGTYTLLKASEIEAGSTYNLTVPEGMAGEIVLESEEDKQVLRLKVYEVKPPPPVPTSNLRLLAVGGYPIVGNDGAGEFVVLTNLDETATYDLSGVRLKIWKTGESPDSAKFDVTFAAGESIAPGGYKMVDNTTYRWDKISNGCLSYELTDSSGEVLEADELDQRGLVDGTGFFALRMIGYELELWLPTEERAIPSLERTPSVAEDFVLTGYHAHEVITLYTRTNVTLTLRNFVATNSTLVVAAIDRAISPCVRVMLEGKNEMATVKSGLGRAAMDFVGCDVEIDGTGSLSLYGEKKLEDAGILEALNLAIRNGKTEIKFKNDKEDTACVVLAGDFDLSGGKLEVSVPKICDCRFFGVRMRGAGTTATLRGGKFHATIGGLNSSALKIPDSGVGLFSGTTVKAEIKGAQASVLRGGVQTYSGGVYKVALHDEVANDYAAITNAHPFKADGRLTITDGEFEIYLPTATTDGISSDNAMVISGGTFHILTGDDCVNAQDDLVFSNAAFFGRSLGGDVLDANGDLTIESGFIEALTVAAGEKGIDVNSDSTLTIRGGTIIATGGAFSRFEGTMNFPQPTFWATDLPTDALSDRYLVFRSGTQRYATRLPVFPSDTGSLRFSSEGLSRDLAYEMTDDPPPIGYLSSQSYVVQDENPKPAVAACETPLEGLFEVARTTSPIWSQSRPEVSSGRFIYRGESTAIPSYYNLVTQPCATYWGGYETTLTLSAAARGRLTFVEDTLVIQPSYPELYYALYSTSDLKEVPFSRVSDWSHTSTFPFTRQSPAAFYFVKISDVMESDLESPLK